MLVLRILVGPVLHAHVSAQMTSQAPGNALEQAAQATGSVNIVGLRSLTWLLSETMSDLLR